MFRWSIFGVLLLLSGSQSASAERPSYDTLPDSLVAKYIVVGEQYEEVIRAMIEYQAGYLDIRVEYDVPTVRFGYPDSSAAKFLWHVAWYNPQENVLIIRPEYADCDPTSVLPGQTSRPRFFLSPLKPCESVLLQDIIAHEAGHVLQTAYLEQYVPDSWIARLNGQDLSGINDGPVFWGYKIIVEGIGEYLQSLVTHRRTTIPRSMWRTSRKRQLWNAPSYYGVLVYNGGETIVTPILEEYGEAGLVYLLTHQLRVHGPTFRSVERYQRSALKALAKQRH